MPDSLQTNLLGQEITYEVRRSTKATEPRIDVDIHRIRVVLPDESAVDAEELLQENAAWVLDQKDKYDTYRAQAPERSFEEGKTFPYLDEPHTVVVERRPSSTVTNGTLRLAEHHVEQTSVKQALEVLYRRKARERFEEVAEKYADEMDIEYEKIEIRNQRTKWGSCSTTGTLGLNWRLMMAPPEIVAYVVIHELAHLREANHSQAFWSLVSEFDPEYNRHANWLEKNSTQLIFSCDDL